MNKKPNVLVLDYGNSVVRFGQNSKGMWLCQELAVYSDSIFTAIKKAKKAILQVEEILAERNKEKVNEE